MATCATHGHLFGADDRCLHCGDPAPQIPEFLRRAREPQPEIDVLRAEVARLIEAEGEVVELAARHHGYMKAARAERDREITRRKDAEAALAVLRGTVAQVVVGITEFASRCVDDGSLGFGEYGVLATNLDLLRSAVAKAANEA